MGSGFSPNLDTKYPDFFDIGTLSIALIGPDEQRRNAVARVLAECHGGGEVREFSSYPPSLDDVPRLLERHYNAIIIDLDSDREYALELVESICANGVATVMVYSEKDDPELLLRCMRSGVREILTLPVTQSTMAEALVRAAARRPANQPKRVGGRLFVFLGAKGGAGVTTIACNFAVALAQDTSQNTLLIDLDLPLGDAALNLGLDSEFSTISALQESGRLDSSFLSKLLVKHSSGLNVLAAPGKFPQYQTSNESIDRLMTVARQSFDNVVVDVGSKLDFVGTALFKEAKTIYLVTQAAIPELRNSNRLIGQFFSAGGPKLEVVINRYQSQTLGVGDEHIEKALTRPVQWRIPNDYAAVRQMQNTATPLVLEDSPISRLIREMVSAASGQPLPQEKKRGFSFRSLGRNHSAKNGTNEEPLSITRLTPGPASAEPPLSPIRPDAKADTPEPFVYTPPAHTLIPPEPLTFSQPPASMDISDDAHPSAATRETLQSSSTSDKQTGPETRTYKGATYVKGTEGQWHILEKDADEVAQETPIIAWPTPAPISYGTALSATQLNATASVSGRFDYAPAKGYVLTAGTHTIWVTFTPTDTTNYTTAQAAVSLTVTMATPIITWPTPQAMTYGTALSATELNATALIPGTFSYDPPAGEVLPAGVQTLTVTFTPADTTKYSTKQSSVLLPVRRAVSDITWPTPDPIAFGASLSATQLNATASVPGTFVYIPAMGAVLAAGIHTPSVFFTPADSENYTPAQAATSLTVTKTVPVITWPTPDSIAYGTALSATELNATASVPGSFAYSPAAGDVLTAGTHALSVTFTPDDTVDYTTATARVLLSVTKAAPTIITWPDPSVIAYGTALSATELNAAASVPGTFDYSPAAGDVLKPGTHTLSVTFTPTDANLPTSEASVSLIVTKATPAIAWSTPDPITYGTALSTSQLNATASVPGTFAYTPVEGDVPAAGTETLSVTFTPTEATDYSTVEASVSLTVTKATPIITWSTPAAISYGTALSATEFDATASVPGTFVCAPAKDTVLAPGTHMISVTFTPADIANYTTAQATVPLVVMGLPHINPLTPAPADADSEDIFAVLQANGAVIGGQKRASESKPFLVETSISTGMQARFTATDTSRGTDITDTKPEALQTGSTTNQPGEPETRIYKGATYVKGADGQWHLKQF
jgi:Flp pilus assembly CpaE family ATPase